MQNPPQPEDPISTEDVIPITEDVKPITEDAKPSTEDVKPSTKETGPTKEELVDTSVEQPEGAGLGGQVLDERDMIISISNDPG